MIKDRFKQKYHFSPERGLLNDPNGLIKFRGEYHFFYQHNPDGCIHANKRWSHRISKDMLEWREVAPALLPVEYFDKDGCYSGSAIEVEDKLYLIYTGNVKNGGIRTPYQVLAESEDGINFKKLMPVLTTYPEGYTAHFRDPKIGFWDGSYHFVIGAQRENLTGTVLLYSSPNLTDWKEDRELILGEDFGYMVECPDLIKLSNRYILISSPQGIEPKGAFYNNRYQSGYIVGGELLDSKDYTFDKFIELDRGFEFYAPQTFKDDDGRTILVGWMGMPEEEDHPTVENGWLHCFTLARELTLKDGKLFQNPIRELENLRSSEKNLKLHNIKFSGEFSDERMTGESYEVLLDLDRCEGILELYLRSDGSSFVKISYDPNLKKVILDRDNLKRGYKGKREVTLEKELESMRIFMDKSSIEIFINSGAEVFTARIYPEEKGREISFFSEKTVTIKNLEFYEI